MAAAKRWNLLRYFQVAATTRNGELFGVRRGSPFLVVAATEISASQTLFFNLLFNVLCN
ncbi:MAG: hypothetical protein KBC07_02955 [Bacteroidales bacterium]|nr:hypothetical protein [Bacteroidales bacterium]